MAEPANGRIRLSWAQIVAFVGWLAIALIAYGAVNSRVSVLEERYDRLFQDISDIKRDLRLLLERGR